MNLPASSSCCSSSANDSSDWSSELWEHVWSEGTTVACVGCSDCVCSAFIFFWKRLSRVGWLSICAEVLQGSKIITDEMIGSPMGQIFQSPKHLPYNGFLFLELKLVVLALWNPFSLPYRDDKKFTERWNSRKARLSPLDVLKAGFRFLLSG